MNMCIVGVAHIACDKPVMTNLCLRALLGSIASFSFLFKFFQFWCFGWLSLLLLAAWHLLLWKTCALPAQYQTAELVVHIEVHLGAQNSKKKSHVCSMGGPK